MDFKWCQIRVGCVSVVSGSGAKTKPVALAADKSIPSIQSLLTVDAREPS